MATRAAIFDMDGVLIDSEPLWWRAGVEALRTVDVHLTDYHFGETIGLRTDAAFRHWFERYPWQGKSSLQLELEVQDRVVQLIGAEGQPLPGVQTLVAFLAEHDIPVGLCSSAPYPVINVVLEKLNIKQYFKVIYSAEDEPLGKPHPGAYLTCASLLDVPANRCIAFEDSLPGAASAKAAQMTVIAVPQPMTGRPAGFGFCDAEISSLLDFTPELLDRLLPASG